MKYNIIFIPALFVLLIALYGCGSAQAYLSEQLERNASALPTEEEVAEEAPPSEAAFLFVHISGAVKEPGVYSLPEGSRVYDAVQAAGGFAEDAGEDSLNLAELLSDGQMYRILTIEESEQEGAYTAAAGGALASVYDAEGRLDINKADIGELTGLNGIGESKAAAIVSYREENGPFAEAKDITKVSGIGEGTYNKIKDAITAR